MPRSVSSSASRSARSRASSTSAPILRWRSRSGRSAAYYAFWAVAEDAPDRARAASMAKAYCGEVARDGCNRATQIHGGMGFTWELALHRYMRRARILEQAFGNSDWHYDRVTEQTVLANGHATRDEAVSV
ncbi:acyl-CoA dehydrogenase family protein [Novosphingobium colocasiae]